MARKKKDILGKVLIANRGEIAMRIIRACRELNIDTVSIFSEADRRSLHVRQADEAVCIGAAPAAESYLNVDSIIAAARETGADAIHPGYGFLAENADFAARVAGEGLVFIGPPASVMRAMGNKIDARRAMRDAGVPIVPGSTTGSDRVKDVVKDALAIDGPVMIKASAGGGGKGMRSVEDRRGVESAVREAIGEAQSAFGDGTVYVEKRIDSPRHVEFQILGDTHGHIVHLCERECSVQRRHQKVLEETPSPALTPELRMAMGNAALAAARAVHYENAGTIEFILDRDGAFYFLEMNTRIQVEHPITEMTTGVDLVQWQLRIARGEELAFVQEQIAPRGHAIECRIYAEDETRNFVPSCGRIDCLSEPSGPGIRNDSGVYEGWEVSPYYDPILSKLIVLGENREAARRRMLCALDEYVVLGVRTSIGLHGRILRHPEFISENVDTGFIERNADALLGGDSGEIPDEAWIAAALVEDLGGVGKCSGGSGDSRAQRAYDDGGAWLWKQIGNWEIGEQR